MTGEEIPITSTPPRRVPRALFPSCQKEGKERVQLPGLLLLLIPEQRVGDVELDLEPGVFPERCTEKLPLRVDFIHRVELGEVSGIPVSRQSSSQNYRNT